MAQARYEARKRIEMSCSKCRDFEIVERAENGLHRVRGGVEATRALMIATCKNIS